jgi:metal-responsive CopG/Arc/MetJ family transcriptional regulator
MKRTLVSLPDELYQIIKTKLMGKLGENDSEVIRSIVIAYLSEHGYFKNENSLSEYIHEDMIGAVVDVLEEKGVMSGQDLDTKMKKRLHSKQNLTKFDELE